MIKNALFGLVSLVSIAAANPAWAVVTTFATVSDNNQDFNWAASGGTGTLTTDSAQGAIVDFQYTNISGLPSYLQGNLEAYMIINNGLGATTTGSASETNGTFNQNMNRTMTIEFELVTPINGLSDLLTVTISKKGSNTPTLSGNGSVVSITTSSNSFNEVFTSDFLSFANASIYSSVIGFISVSPALSLNGSQLSNFAASALLANFSADPVPTVVPEPGSLAALIGGLMALTFVARRRRTNNSV